MKRSPGIYVIRNIKNSKQYVGGTSNVVNRKRQHFSDLKLNKHGNKPLQDDYNLFGKDCFQFVVLEILSIDASENDIVNSEQKWMDFISPEYNINQIAGRYIGDYVRSPEAVAKLRKTMTGRKLTPEHAKHISDALKRSTKNKGIKRSDETRERVRQANLGEKNPNYGKPRTEETKKKISKSNYKTYVGAISPDGIVYAPIVGMREFCKQHDLNESCMVALMRHRRNDHKGWIRYEP